MGEGLEARVRTVGVECGGVGAEGGGVGGESRRESDAVPAVEGEGWGGSERGVGGEEGGCVLK